MLNFSAVRWIISNDANWLWSCIQAFAVSISVLFVAWQIKIQTASHVVQTLALISERWNSETMLRARHHVCVQWRSKEFRFDGVASYIAEYFEELGHYMKLRAIPDEDMWQAQSWYLEHYFCMFRAGIYEMRKAYRDNTLYSCYIELFDRMAVFDRKHGAPESIRMDDEISEFIESELTVCEAFLALKTSKPNQALEPTPLLVTPVADAPVAPSKGVAHL